MNIFDGVKKSELFNDEDDNNRVIDVNCIICEKILKAEYLLENGDLGTEKPFVINGGSLKCYFGYGSKHDYAPKSEPTPLEKLTSSNEIEAFICDECFEKKYNLCKGYDVKEFKLRIPTFDP